MQKKTGLPLADVKRLRRIRIIVFEHLQKAGAWMVITRAKGGIAARRAFTSDSLHKTFKTREDWETAIRMANMERNIKPHTIVLALTSLGTAIKKQRGFVPASPEPERHTAVEKPSAKKKTNAPKPLSTFDQSLSTSKRRKRAINLILNSNSPEAVKQRMLARVAKYEQEHPQKRTAIK